MKGTLLLLLLTDSVRAQQAKVTTLFSKDLTGIASQGIDSANP
jgi:hypothetical protein